MKTSDYIREHGIGKLVEEFKIKVKYHDTEPLVILNYDQIESPKADDLVRECRGLVLCTRDWSVVARPFKRFFNWGEAEGADPEFDWDSAVVQEKYDGSLAIVYWWAGEWRMNTRNSFGDGPIEENSEDTFSEVFWSVADKKAFDARYPANETHLFELVGPRNKVVRTYEEPEVYHLATIENETGEEVEFDTDYDFYGVKRAEEYLLNDHEEVLEFLSRAEKSDPTFEGFVVRDKNGTRKKIKTATYVALHHMKGDGGFHPKRLLPFILNGESAEVLSYFPEAKEEHDPLKEYVDQNCFELADLYKTHGSIEDQKEFALAVKDETPFSGVLFMARKTGRDPVEIFKEMPDMIVKKYLERR